MSLSSLGQVLRVVGESGDPAALAPPAELLAAVVLESNRPEWEFLKHSRLCIGYALEAGGAGTRSILGLVNPVGSNTLAVVEQFEGTSVGDRLTIHLMTALLFAGFDSDGAEGQRDTRGQLYNTTAQPPSCSIVTDQAATPGGVWGTMFAVDTTATRSYFHHKVEYVLQPGSGICVATTVDNNILYGQYIWRETALTPRELIGAARAQ